MARHVLIAMNGAVPGADAAEVERWYEEVHLADIKTITGVTSARRYTTLRGHVPNNPLWPHVAIYEIEVDDLESIRDEFQTKIRPFHPDLDRSNSLHVFAIQSGGDA